MRHSAGAIGLVLLAIGGMLYMQPTGNPFWAGLAIRVGALLVVIWLAYNQLMERKGKLPAILVGFAMVCLLIVAARPNQGRVLIGLLAVLLAVSSVMRWISNMTTKPG